MAKRPREGDDLFALDAPYANPNRANASFSDACYASYEPSGWIQAQVFDVLYSTANIMRNNSLRWGENKINEENGVGTDQQPIMETKIPHVDQPISRTWTDDEMKAVFSNPSETLGARWYPKYIDLCEYIYSHGKLPSTKLPGIGKWLSDQRRAYKGLIQGNKSSSRLYPMTKERIIALESLPTWTWESLQTRQKAVNKEILNQEAKEAKKKKEKGKAPSTQTPTQQTTSANLALESIGANLLDRDAEWMAKYKEVCAYISENDGISPTTTHPTLGQWIHRQRKNFEKFAKNPPENADSSITSQRIKILECTPGWHWTGSEAYETRWQKRLKELKAYVAEHNAVPCTRMTVLGKWVYAQKKGYKAYSSGQSCSNKMTKARVKDLESVPLWRW